MNHAINNILPGFAIWSLEISITEHLLIVLVHISVVGTFKVSEVDFPQSSIVPNSVYLKPESYFAGLFCAREIRGVDGSQQIDMFVKGFEQSIGLFSASI